MYNELYIVTVLFKPSSVQIERFIKLSLHYKIIAIDNTPSTELPISQSASFDTYIALKENKGIAFAQNVGIREVRKKNGKYILFFDQDSDVEIDFPSNLLNRLKTVELENKRIAALGPMIYNKVTGKPYKNYVNTHCIDDENAICPTIISSGTISPVWAFEKVGMMNESLFIDFVDHEWCWRANNKGYICCMNYKLQLLHQVGQKNITCLGFPFLLASPFRYYYQYRNACWLQKKKYVPLGWKIKILIRNIVGLLYLPWFIDNPLLTIKYMLRGLRDGLIFKMHENESFDK